MQYFKDFYVKPKPQEDDPDIAINWNAEKYKVLTVEIKREQVPIIEEKKIDRIQEVGSDIDDEDYEEQKMEEDIQFEEQIAMWFLLGNPKTKEMKFFEVAEVDFISAD